jgi:hypothetical protein
MTLRTRVHACVRAPLRPTDAARRLLLITTFVVDRGRCYVCVRTRMRRAVGADC